ncbi:N-acetylglucosamine kinase [Streptomyces qinglanensis]|uniref:BadF-type ATPase n=1 Tax=Streptomyces qinglanensis TaxID=943816 RepID=A0A1H9R6V3_9ACTN|nr:BadF/BadG/BcrA/BcrD ATPase family protein [Streptomyces qinglanensis]SER68591.1 BadF-type ATPase [Streptomyces qinglanensis]
MGLSRPRSAAPAAGPRPTAPAAGPRPAASAAAGTAGSPDRAPGAGRSSPALLALDAGNSKTDVALLDADGRVLGTARGGGFRPPAVGVDAAVDVLAEAVDRARAAAGPGGGAAAPVRQVTACLANADLPVEEEALAAALTARGWGRRVAVHNDTFAVLRAGVAAPGGEAAPRGVAVVCGAGINCVGVRSDGRTARFPALGRLSGDWGGGGGLAEEALWHAARAEDGRGGPTLLRTTLPAHFGLESVYALIEAVHLGHIAWERRLELVPVLFAAAGRGDAVADGLVARMADEVVTMAVVALRELDLLAEEVPVLLGGGVLAAGHALLDDRVTRLLAERAPRAVPRVVRARPVLGAALLGLDALGAPVAAHERARRHFEPPRPADGASAPGTGAAPG